jgi:hypothetical protein
VLVTQLYREVLLIVKNRFKRSSPVIWIYEATLRSRRFRVYFEYNSLKTSLIRSVSSLDSAFKEVILRLTVCHLNSFLRTLTSFVVRPLGHILTFKSALKQTASNVVLYIPISPAAHSSISVDSLLLTVRSWKGGLFSNCFLQSVLIRMGMESFWRRQL